MFRTFWVRSSGPIPKLLLFCSGTLIRLATGFCVAFCNSPVALEVAFSWAAIGVPARHKKVAKELTNTELNDGVRRPSLIIPSPMPLLEGGEQRPTAKVRCDCVK